MKTVDNEVANKGLGALDTLTCRGTASNQPDKRGYPKTAFPEHVLWNCIEAMPDVDAVKAASTWSLVLGATHSFEARSMLVPVLRILSPSAVVETGTFHGLTSAFIWETGALEGRPPKITTFDISASTLAPSVWRALGAMQDISFVHGDSGSFVSSEFRGRCEFALIDGDHSYEAAERDWKVIEPVLADRSVVFLDNMSHPAGCGEFFKTLNPLWFHPEMAILVRGLRADDVGDVFRFYVERQLSIWVRLVTSKQGEEAHELTREVLVRLEAGPQNLSAYGEIADKCRSLSTIAACASNPLVSETFELSSRYGILSEAEVKRQRMRESAPRWILKLAAWLRGKN